MFLFTNIPLSYGLIDVNLDSVRLYLDVFLFTDIPLCFYLQIFHYVFIYRYPIMFLFTDIPLSYGLIDVNLDSVRLYLDVFLFTDIPLSYGLIDVNLDSVRLNQAEFIWDPTKETGVYIRVHCISTEFTAKKHGGEKGVPFRIQVETYTNMSTDSKLIHCASCQVKVFKVRLPLIHSLIRFSLIHFDILTVLYLSVEDMFINVVPMFQKMWCAWVMVEFTRKCSLGTQIKIIKCIFFIKLVTIYLKLLENPQK